MLSDALESSIQIFSRPFRTVMWKSLGLTAIVLFLLGLGSLLVNLAVLALTLFTGVGFATFFVLNGYMLGREYFELTAMRHLSFPQAVDLRHQRSFDVFIAGMIVAVFVAIPLLNPFTPLFATAFMTRRMKRLA